MFQSRRPQQQPQRQEQAPSFSWIPHNTQTEASLRKFTELEYQIQDAVSSLRICQSVAQKQITCFANPTETFGLQPEDYRVTSQGMKRSFEGEEEDHNLAGQPLKLGPSPRAQFRERANARAQLSRFEAELETSETEQAQFIYELKKKCLKRYPYHDYVVFYYKPPPPLEAAAPDMTDLRCIRCFDAIGSASAAQSTTTNSSIPIYLSSVDFNGKIMKQGSIHGPSSNQLQALF